MRACLHPSSTYDHDFSLRSSNRGRSSPPLQPPLLQTSTSNDRRTASGGHGRRTLPSRPNPRHNNHLLPPYPLNNSSSIFNRSPARSSPSQKRRIKNHSTHH